MKLTIEPQSYYFLAIEGRLNIPHIIHRPDAVENPYTHGVVLAVGPDCKKTKVGDKVLYLPSNAIGLEHPDHGLCHIVPDSAVFAKYVVEETEQTK